MKKELIFRGNEKCVYATDHPDQVIFRYTDVTVAYNNIKRARFVGKGVLDNQISAILLDYLNKNGIETHFIEVAGPDEQLCRRIEIIPLMVVVRNRLVGSESARLGVEDGFKPGNTVLEMRYNVSELGDPLINEHHAVALGLMTYEELAQVKQVALQTNQLLGELLHKVGIELVDMRLEFGRASDNGHIIISDEISPDTCRFWDEATGEKLDKDRFRLDLSDVVASYRKVLDRLNTLQ